MVYRQFAALRFPADHDWVFLDVDMLYLSLILIRTCAGVFVDCPHL